MNQESQTIVELQEVKEIHISHLFTIGGTVLFLIGLIVITGVDYKTFTRLLHQFTTH